MKIETLRREWCALAKARLTTAADQFGRIYLKRASTFIQAPNPEFIEALIGDTLKAFSPKGGHDYSAAIAAVTAFSTGRGYNCKQQGWRLDEQGNKQAVYDPMFRPTPFGRDRNWNVKNVTTACDAVIAHLKGLQSQLAASRVLM